MPNNPLDVAASVTLDTNGNGVASIGPNVGQHWVLGNIAVYVSTAVAEPQCAIYTNVVAPSNVIDATYTGSRNSTDSAKGIRLGPGQKVIAAWVGGDPGAVATVSIYGTVET